MNPVILTSIDDQIRNQESAGRVASFLKKFKLQYEKHEALESDKYAVRSAHATLKESFARAVEVSSLAHAQLDYLTEPIDVATVLAENFERTNYPFLRLAGQLQPQLLLAQNATAVLEILGSRRSKIQDELILLC